jgi:nucleoside diphosphate kinase
VVATADERRTGVDEVDWDRTVFVLIAPDAVTRRLGGAVLDRLVASGYRPSAWRVLWHRPANLDAFHEKKITTAWRAYFYRLVDRLFGFGPTVAMLLRDERPDGDSHERLCLAKGASEPAEAAPGTIRADLGSVNAMLALMHSSDSPADSRLESGVFFGPHGLTGAGEPGELRAQLALLDGAGPVERRGYRQVLSGVRARLLAAAWEQLDPGARREAAAALSAGVGALADPGAGARLAGWLPAGHPLGEVLAADFTPEHPGPDPDRVRPLLRLYGTDLDPWEDLVLATSRRFRPRRDDDPALPTVAEPAARTVTPAAAAR